MSNTTLLSAWHLWRHQGMLLWFPEPLSFAVADAQKLGMSHNHISNSQVHPCAVAWAEGHQLPGHISCAGILPLDLWNWKAFEFFYKNPEVVSSFLFSTASILRTQPNVTKTLHKHRHPLAQIVCGENASLVPKHCKLGTKIPENQENFSFFPLNIPVWWGASAEGTAAKFVTCPVLSESWRFKCSSQWSWAGKRKDKKAEE